MSQSEKDEWYRTGDLAYQSGDLKEAKKWLQLAANAGDSSAMFYLGHIAKQSGDPKEAKKWWQLAAGAGHSDAMTNLGVLVSESGNKKEAKKWYQLAADAGEPYAMANLGELAFHSGDIKVAKKWYRLVVDAGNAAALISHSETLNNLGAIAENLGDVYEAEKWFYLAAESIRAEKIGAEAVEAGILTVAHGYREQINQLKYFTHHCPEILTDEVLGHMRCTDANDVKEEVLITGERICFFPQFKRVGRVLTKYLPKPVQVAVDDIKHLEVSFRHITTHSPFMSDVTRTWLALNFVTIDDRSFLRFLWVGETETERNENLPNRKEKIKELQQLFDVVEVENYESSSGSSSAPFSIGVFNVLD